MLSVTGEYLFVLDRSGSMKGQRFDYAKKALVLALKSLPLNSYFNIVSFGTKTKFMYETSLTVTNENVNKTIQEVENFHATYGGSDLASPLKSIYCLPRIQRYPRSIFVLTDGETENSELLYNIIEQGSSHARLFCLGISSSYKVIEAMARLGRGRFEIVKTQEELPSKLVGLLNSALSPCCYELSMTIEHEKNVQMLAPAPEATPSVLRDESAIFYIFFDRSMQEKETSEVTLNFTVRGISKQIKHKHTFSLDFKKAESNTAPFKLCLLESIKILEKDRKNSTLAESIGIYYNKEVGIEEKVYELAISSQLLCPKTALILISKHVNPNETTDLTKNKITAPSWIPSANLIDEEQKLAALKASVSAREIKLSDDQIQKCKEAFQQIDTDGDGNVMFNELRSVLQLLRQNPNSNELEDMILQTDFEAWGVMDFREFLQMMSRTIFTTVNLVEDSKNSTTSEIQDLEKPSVFRGKRDEKDFYQVVKMQKVEGDWQFDSVLFKLLDLDIDLFVKMKPTVITELEEESDNVWITLAIVIWLEQVFPQIKNKWILIQKKALAWLNSKGFQSDPVALYSETFKKLYDKQLAEPL